MNTTTPPAGSRIALGFFYGIIAAIGLTILVYLVGNLFVKSERNMRIAVSSAFAVGLIGGFYTGWTAFNTPNNITTVA